MLKSRQRGIFIFIRFGWQNGTSFLARYVSWPGKCVGALGKGLARVPMSFEADMRFLSLRALRNETLRLVSVVKQNDVQYVL